MIQELPHNKSAERAFLSMLFTRPQMVLQYSSRVLARDFFEPRHALIYASLQRIACDPEHRLPLDIVGVCTDLNEQGKLSLAGGSIEVSGIAEMSFDKPVSLNDAKTCQQYADIILDTSRRRAAIKLMEEAMAKASTESVDVAAMVSDMQAALSDPRGGGASTMDASLDKWVEWFAVAQSASASSTVKTGIDSLDKITGGFSEGQLVILGARPSMGKTALSLNIAAEACRSGKRVAFFSLEMTERELISRLLAAEGKISATHVNVPSIMTSQERAVVDVVFPKMREWKLYISDTAGQTVSQMASISRRLNMSGGLDLVIIDHLNYIGAEGRNENRTNEVRKISAGLKSLAKELSVPVICLCQLSRAVESRDDKRPKLADLRESGTIEQDADIVLLLYRDSYYSNDASNKSAELRIAKQRNGRTGTINLIFDSEHQKFTEDIFSGRTTRLREEDIPS